MSARLLRRVLQEQEQQQLKQTDADLEVDTDEESDPSMPPAPFRNPFDLLHDQEDEQEVDDGEGTRDVAKHENSVPVAKSSSDHVPLANRKSKKKKNKKGKEDATNTKREAEEIDKLIDLASVDLSNSFTPYTHQHGSSNLKAGAAEVQTNTKKQGTLSVLNVDPKYLKAENELRKIFGSKVVSSFENNHIVGSSRQVHGGRRAAHNSRKTVLVSPSGYWPRWDGSLAMEFLETKDGIHYFRYVQPPSQSYTQEALEAAKAIHDLNAIAHILARHPYHIEALLIFAEVFKFSGEHQSSADAIGKCLYALECAWHPHFTPLQGNCQLKYNHDTSKPFFSALFSHMKNLDRRGCHRSALEVCKLLLSLDSDDPMGALICIDYFALRAQEFAWLEQFSEEYRNDNSIWLFPNFSYSLAVCRFYLEQNTASQEAIRKNERATAIDMMKQALMLHPLVLKKLVVKAPMKDTAWNQILKNSFFGSAQAGSSSLDRLIEIYVERNYIMWRYPELQSFLKEVALQVIESLKHKGSEAKDWACVRKEAFSSEQNEYSHLLVSDFSDTVPSIPPEELRHFMVGPNMVHDLQDGDGGANLDRAQAPREVTGRNAAVVFLESLLPWINYGPNRNGELDDQDIED